MVSGPLAWLFARAKSGAHLHMRTCSLLFVSWKQLDGCAEIWCMAWGPLAMHFTHDERYLHEYTGNCHTFKHIYSLPLVYRPKGVSLVLRCFTWNGNDLIYPSRRVGRSREGRWRDGVWPLTVYIVAVYLLWPGSVPCPFGSWSQSVRQLDIRRPPGLNTTRSSVAPLSG